MIALNTLIRVGMTLIRVEIALIRVELRSIEDGICPTKREKCIVGTSFDDPTVDEDDDLLRAPNR